MEAAGYKGTGQAENQLCNRAGLPDVLGLAGKSKGLPLQGPSVQQQYREEIREPRKSLMRKLPVGQGKQEHWQSSREEVPNHPCPNLRQGQGVRSGEEERRKHSAAVPREQVRPASSSVPRSGDPCRNHTPHHEVYLEQRAMSGEQSEQSRNYVRQPT